MKKLFFVWCSLIVLTLSVALHGYIPKKAVKKTLIVSPLPTTTPPALLKNQKETVSLFIPYWEVSDKPIDSTNYSRLIYFGIVPSKNGIDKTGDGYKKLPQFLAQATPGKEKFLSVQMINTPLNSKVLEDTQLGDGIITESLALAKKNGFNGIVLDFEYSALPFPSVTNGINNFTSRFAKKTHEAKLQYYILVYGDVFYRLRPYDIPVLGKQADGIMIMAYDFHKANGDPGADFPLTMRSDEGYDFKNMTTDFLKILPANKLEIVFGMFGYDWVVNEKNQSIAAGSSLSLNEIKQKFLSTCSFLDCTIKRDKLSTEMEITYNDAKHTSHDVWFEDMGSVAQKKAYLQSKGIYNTAFWAYSYF